MICTRIQASRPWRAIQWRAIQWRATLNAGEGARRTAGLFCLAMLLLSIALGAAAWPTRAQESLRAAAVVNDEVISDLDLYMRTRLAILSSGITPTPEAQSRLQRQILRQLIDERLQLQEAGRLGISVPDEDTERAFEMIAGRNDMTREQFQGMLRQNGILPMALNERLRAEIAWQQVARIRLMPTIEIGDEEVNEVLARIEASQGQLEVQVSEIFLEVDGARDEEEVRRGAERLLEQLRGGADFAALARQFSQAATAPVGGDRGWIQQSQLADELAGTLSALRPGHIAGPLRGLSGYHIVLLRDRRAIAVASGGTVRLSQIFFALPPGAGEAEVATLMSEASSVRGRIASCADAERLAAEVGSPGSGDLGTLRIDDLPPALGSVVRSLPLEQPSEPMRLGGGIGVLVVCERASAGPDRERILERLRLERLQMLGRRYLRDLRRGANVDIRQ